MLLLRLDDLSVASFDATPDERLLAAVKTTRDTEQVECFSPLCGPTFWRTCEPCEPVVVEPAEPVATPEPASLA